MVIAEDDIEANGGWFQGSDVWIKSAQPLVLPESPTCFRIPRVSHGPRLYLMARCQNIKIYILVVHTFLTKSGRGAANVSELFMLKCTPWKLTFLHVFFWRCLWDLLKLILIEVSGGWPGRSGPIQNINKYVFKMVCFECPFHKSMLGFIS